MPKHEPKPEKPNEPEPDPSAILDQAVDEIWGYVRLHCNSLDSGRCCEDIRNLVVNTTDVFRDRIIELETRLEEQHTAVRAAKRLLTCK